MKAKYKQARSIFIRLFLLSLFLFVFLSIIAYARGYRLDLRTKSLTPTGILAVTSSPKAAKVYLNGVLKGVTDINLTLPPGDYTIEMKKEGYTDWKKSVKLKGEIVMSLDGLLFPRNPSLSPLTSLGIQKVLPIEQTSRMILVANNDDLEKDGLYIFETTQRPLSLLPPLKPLLLKKYLPAAVPLENITATFSPDYDQAIIDFKTDEFTASYLISLNDENVQPFDVTDTKEPLIAAWNEKKNKDVSRILQTFPKEIEAIATDSFHLIAFSPDETKVLYQATRSATIPQVIKPPLIAASQAEESRTIEPKKLYVYDRKEDKNFEVKDVRLEEKASPTPRRAGFPSPTPIQETIFTREFAESVLWYIDSKHFIINEGRQLAVVDYDGGNRRTIYSGPFENDFFTVNAEGKLLILTNLNPQSNHSPDLYEVGIR